MADIEDLKLECRDIPSASDRGSSSDSDDSGSSSGSSSSSGSRRQGNKRRMRSRERQRKRAPPRKTCRHRSGSSSLERPPGNWRGRARSEDFRRSKSRDTPSPRRCSPRRCSPRRGSPRRRTPERHKRDRYDRRMPEDRHRFDDRRGFSRDRDLGYGRPRSPLRRRPRSDSPRRFRQRQRDVRDPPPSDKPRRFGMKVMEEDRHVAARNPPLIISCSRRTDVPWGFLRQYLNGFEDGFMYIASGPRKNPVVRAVCVQPYNPQTGKGVMCISWWSKNYKKWIQAWQKPDSVLHRYPVHLFNYTVNSENLALEPGVDTSLTERLGQLTFLVQTFGAHAVSPRFDPIVHYRNLVGGPIMDNMKDFETIVRHVGSLGVDHIVFSFCQAYPKSVRNMRLSGMELVTLNRAEQCAVLDKLMPIAHRYGVQMRCCGDKGIVGYPITKSETEGLVAAAQREEQKMQGANFPVIGQSRCVDARLADRIAREKGLNVFMSLAKDLRQRKDCECTRSTDIGEYTLQCPHGCVYCYANPLRRKGQNEPPQVTNQAPVVSHQQLPPPPMIPHMPAPQCAPTGYMPPHYMPSMPAVGVPGMPMPMPMPPPPGHPGAPAMAGGVPPPPPLPQPGANASEMMMNAYKLNWPAGLMTYASHDPGEVLAKMAECQTRP
mmetsp:Transcript_66304/g.134716  ORF Transcript_66304/g.134716 Transcript_66304/m.134716 type:complete len:660 (-) Transcript_66304:158-2137(-)